jgi:PEP-CTERM motif
MNIRIGLVAAAAVLAAQGAAAQGFNSGLPAGWVCEGSCGTLGANGDITLSGIPGSTAYGWVSTANSQANGFNLSPFKLGDETNGSRLRSGSFAALAGDKLEFKFNYVSSDGTTDFIEYAWALVRDAAALDVEALLFTGRTNPNGPPVPGFGLPATQATVNGGVPVAIVSNAPDWSPLGGSSGGCFGGLGAGCGYTGWVNSEWSFVDSGNYILEFGVINWADQQFDAGMAFDGITVAGKPIDPPPPIPEPETYALMLAGLGAVALAARRRRAGKA